MNDDDTFVKLIEGVLPDQIISNFILIAEISDGDSKKLAVILSPEITPWLASGMVESATEFMFDNRDD